MNVRYLFDNQYRDFKIEDKIYKVRGLSLLNILDNDNLMTDLFEIINQINSQGEDFYLDDDNIDKNFNMFFEILSSTVKDFSEDDKDNISELLVEVLFLSLPSKPKEIIPSKNSKKPIDKNSSKYVDNSIIEQKKTLSKKEYLERLNISQDIYSYVELAEFLRTKNIKDPYELSLNNIVVLTQIHITIENNYLLKLIDKDISSRAIFEGDDTLYIETITRLTQ